MVKITVKVEVDLTKVLATALALLIYFG